MPSDADTFRLTEERTYELWKRSRTAPTNYPWRKARTADNYADIAEAARACEKTFDWAIVRQDIVRSMADFVER